MWEILDVIKQSRAMRYLRVLICGRHLRRAHCTEQEASIHTRLEGGNLPKHSWWWAKPSLSSQSSLPSRFFYCAILLSQGPLYQDSSSYSGTSFGALIRGGLGFTSLHGIWYAFRSGREGLLFSPCMFGRMPWLPSMTWDFSYSFTALRIW